MLIHHGTHVRTATGDRALFNSLFEIFNFTADGTTLLQLDWILYNLWSQSVKCGLSEMNRIK